MGDTVTVLVPDIGDFDQVDVAEVLVKVGDAVQVEDSLITLESDKASMEVPSDQAGVVQEVKVSVGDQVSKGDVIVVLEAGKGEPAEGKESADRAKAAPKENGADEERTAEEPVAQRTAQAEPASEGRPYASPAVRRMAREQGVDLSKVIGSGRQGRILKEDLEGAAAQPVAASPTLPAVDFSKFGPTETQDLNRIRRLTAEHVHGSWVNIPHVTQFDEADITEMEELRKAHAEEAKAKGFKLTPVAFLMKACVKALKEFPQFNSSLDPSGGKVILKSYYNIRIAVDTPQGLMVPVIRDVDRKGLFELAQELAELSQRTRDGKNRMSDLQGGTFSISSLGGIGGTAFTPIVNAPEVAILGVSRASIRPVFKDGQFVPRLMLPLSLSYDHRVVDGADGARFTTYLRRLLEDLRRLLF